MIISCADAAPHPAAGVANHRPYLSVSVVRDLGATVALRVAGEIDMASATTFSAFLEDLITDGRRILIVDVEQVSLFGADALRVLASVRRRLRPVGGSTHLVCTRPLTLRVLIVTGMIHAIPLHASVAAAIRAVEPFAPPSP